MSSPQSLPNRDLIEKFKILVLHERKITAEVVDYLREIDRRKVYLELGYTSSFSFLTKGLGYSPSAAQRRIDSARLMQMVPEIKNDLQAGSLNLTQVAIIAQAIRQKKTE